MPQQKPAVSRRASIKRFSSSQQGPKLVGVPDGRPSFQGWSVALSGDGNTAILGAPDAAAGGTAWVFTRSGGTWTQQGSNLVYVNEDGNAQFGWSVALSGDGNTALVGGRIGEAWVYTRAGSVWTQQGPMLVGIGAVGGNPGYSVALSADGNTAILGGPDDNNAVGAAWIFTRSGGRLEPAGTEAGRQRRSWRASPPRPLCRAVSRWHHRHRGRAPRQ